MIGLAREKQKTEMRLAADGHRNVHVIAADLTDRDSLDTAAREVEEILGGKGLDVLINNAAYVSSRTALKSLRD